MALQRTRLTDPAFLAAAAAAVYTNPAATKTHVRGFLLHNTDSAAVIVTLHFVPASGGAVGTAAAGNRILKVSLAADETLLFEVPFGLVMTATNDTIQGLAGTASKVVCMVLGDKDA